MTDKNNNAPTVETRPCQSLGPTIGSEIPRPTSMRRLWVPGIQYEGETTAQMTERERRYREDDKRTDQEEARLYKWKCTPWWLLPNGSDHPRGG